MITPIIGLPNTVLGFSGSGQISKREFEEVLIPAVDKMADHTGSLCYLFVLETDISNMSAGAWIDHIKGGIMHLGQWKKIAIASDQEGVDKFTELVNPTMLGEVRSFTLDELDRAKAWLTEKQVTAP